MSVSGGTNRTTGDVIERFQEGRRHLVRHEAANQRPRDFEGVDGRTACKPDGGEDDEDDEAQRCSRRPTRTSV
jgi:hypothetical protein